MAKVSVPQRLSRDDFSGKYEDDCDTLIGNVSDFQDQVLPQINGGLDSTNTTSDYLPNLTFVHGVETRVKNPLAQGVQVRGVYAISARGISVDSSGKPNGGADYQLANPTVSWRFLDTAQTKLGITCTFAPPSGYCQLTSTVAQTGIASGAVVFPQFNITTFASGALSHSNTINNTRITCAQSGIVLVAGNCGFGVPTSPSGILLSIFKNSTSQYWQQRVGDGAPNNSSAISTSGLVDVAAGDYLEIRAAQFSGAARDVTPSNNLFAAKYVDVIPGTTAKVTLYVFGG